MNKYIIPKCPKCHQLLTITETYDSEYYDNGKIINHNIGVCPCCREEYTWLSIYVFSEIDTLEPVEIHEEYF